MILLQLIPSRPFPSVPPALQRYDCSIAELTRSVKGAVNEIPEQTAWHYSPCPRLIYVALQHLSLSLTHTHTYTQQQQQQHTSRALILSTHSANFLFAASSHSSQGNPIRTIRSLFVAKYEHTWTVLGSFREQPFDHIKVPSGCFV